MTKPIKLFPVATPKLHREDGFFRSVGEPNHAWWSTGVCCDEVTDMFNLPADAFAIQFYVYREPGKDRYAAWLHPSATGIQFADRDFPEYLMVRTYAACCYLVGGPQWQVPMLRIKPKKFYVACYYWVER
jgi:hypothetical protein